MKVYQIAVREPNDFSINVVNSFLDEELSKKYLADYEKKYEDKDYIFYWQEFDVTTTMPE